MLLREFKFQRSTEPLRRFDERVIGGGRWARVYHDYWTFLFLVSVALLVPAVGLTLGLVSISGFGTGGAVTILVILAMWIILSFRPTFTAALLFFVVLVSYIWWTHIWGTQPQPYSGPWLRDFAEFSGKFYVGFGWGALFILFLTFGAVYFMFVCLTRALLSLGGFQGHFAYLSNPLIEEVRIDPEEKDITVQGVNLAFEKRTPTPSVFLARELPDKTLVYPLTVENIELGEKENPGEIWAKAPYRIKPGKCLLILINDQDRIDHFRFTLEDEPQT